MPTFWRVLEDAPLLNAESLEVTVNPQSTRRRWGRGEFNSTHKSCPLEWQQKWLQGQTAAADYGPADLNCNTGLHTQDALNAFLAAAQAHGLGVPWPDDVLVAVGQLEGICAWETKEQAWHYVLGKLPDEAIDDCTITEEKLAMSSVVEFTGDDLGVAIPEGQGEGGGRQVRVTHPGVIMPAQQFAEVNGFVIPWGSNDINLDNAGEDDE
jgi:hypothetical protein